MSDFFDFAASINELKAFDLVQITLNKVLLVGTRNSSYIGTPVVTNAAVHAVVEEQVIDHLMILSVLVPERMSFCIVMSSLFTVLLSMPFRVGTR